MPPKMQIGTLLRQGSDAMTHALAEAARSPSIAIPAEIEQHRQRRKLEK
jgi:hypothetical protein